MEYIEFRFEMKDGEPVFLVRENIISVYLRNGYDSFILVCNKFNVLRKRDIVTNTKNMLCMVKFVYEIVYKIECKYSYRGLVCELDEIDELYEKFLEENK